MVSGDYLVLETKGKDHDLSKTKRTFLKEWIEAVNVHGGFGIWHEAISFSPGDLDGILERFV
jgi:type III restriction enzyme